MIFYSYDTPDNLFDVNINDNEFIQTNTIMSIKIDEQELIITFFGEQHEMTKENNEKYYLWMFKNKKILQYDEILEYLKSQSHTVTVNLYDRYGIIYKTDIYHNCKFENVTVLENNLYEIKLILQQNGVNS